MIQSLSIKNFLSFKEEQTISFEAANIVTDFEEYHVVTMPDGMRLLKLGIVYGYNASGKSNLIQAFDFIQDYWLATFDNKEDFVEFLPFLLNQENKDKPTEFKLIFYANNIKYKYELSVKDNITTFEKLDFYPGTQPANIFERVDEDGVSVIRFGAKMNISSTIHDAISLKCLPNISFFAAYNQVNTKIKEISNVITWMRYHVMQKIEPVTKLQHYTEQLINKDSHFKEPILRYLQNADFNISNINSEEIVSEVSDEFIQHVKEMGLPDVELKRLEKEHTIKTLNTSFEHSVKNKGETETYTFPIEWQSDGTKRIFGLSGPLQELASKNAFLTVDEIEAKLHPSLVEYLIENFLRQSEQSQMLVTTHYDNLFDEDEILRKDNFYFTAKDEDGATEIYRLTDFKGLNRISSLQKAYRFGKFGAVPNID